jgi:hypothetical protein
MNRRERKAQVRADRKAQASAHAKPPELDGFALPDGHPAGMDAGSWGMLVALAEFLLDVSPRRLTSAERVEGLALMRRMFRGSGIDAAKYHRAYRETCTGIASAQADLERAQALGEDS